MPNCDVYREVFLVKVPHRTFVQLTTFTDEIYGLYHYFFADFPLNKIIQHVEIPTLDYIPETPELNALEKSLRNENRREYFIKDRLISHLGNYEVIIFDNSPHWSCLDEACSQDNDNQGTKDSTKQGTFEIKKDAVSINRVPNKGTKKGTDNSTEKRYLGELHKCDRKTHV